MSPTPKTAGHVQSLPYFIFASRWLQLPLYLGLIVAQGVYVFQFWVELVHLVEAAFGNQTALATLVKSGDFRQDLFYRLNVFPIHLPPLRERREDIPLLAAFFLEQQLRRYRKPVTGFEPSALDALNNHSWPGNVRQLRNNVERLMILTHTDPDQEVTSEMLPTEVAMLSDTADEAELAARLRKASPSATPNARLVAIADAMLGRDGRMREAIAGIGRGADAFEGTPFRLTWD